MDRSVFHFVWAGAHRVHFQQTSFDWCVAGGPRAIFGELQAGTGTGEGEKGAPPEDAVEADVNLQRPQKMF